jgi:site-specific DNA-methyltransferase (adenine-specific)/modification methylase
MPDKSVDAVITDPPYGMSLDTDYSGIDNGRGKKYARVEGDNKRFDPTPFLKIGKRHILWGAQYFCHSLPEVGGWLVFNKRGNGEPSKICFGDCELAWCDAMQSVRMYSEQWHGYYRTQKAGGITSDTKPVGLMRWCIEKFTSEVTHLRPLHGIGYNRRRLRANRQELHRL